MSKTVIIIKIREWIARYLPAEIIGTLTALAGAVGVHTLTHSLAASAIAGSIAETIGFYGYFAVRGCVSYYAQHSTYGRRRRVYLTLKHTLRDLLIEFGPAEVVDSLLARPFLMYAGPHVLHNFAAGILAGKLAADLIFCVLVATGLELKKHFSRT